MMHRKEVGSSGQVSLAVWCGLLVLIGLTATTSTLGQDARRDRAPTPARGENRPGAPVVKSPRPARPPDPVSSLLDNIDPKLLNLSGAELDYEVVGDQLILRGNERDLDVIELLIAVLEQTTDQKELRVVTVTEKDANDIARTVEPALQGVFFEPNRRPELELSITALSANIILVSALPDQLDFIVGVIKQVDEVEDRLPEQEQLVFRIKHRRAADVAEQLTEIISKMREKQGQAGAKGAIQVIANDANNSIMVLAPETERSKIQALLNELDVEPVKGWGEVKLTLFPLIHSKANEMADVINELLTSQQDRDAAEEVIYRLQISKALPSGEIVELSPIDLQKPMRILADEGTNSLIVATVEENVGPIGELIRLMDGVPMAEDFGLRLFPLRFADAESLRDLLSGMFDDAKNLPEDPDGSGAGAVPTDDRGRALVYNVGITADVRTNTLIVTGRPEQLQLAADMVDQLDRPARALKFPLRFIQLDHTDATKVGQIVTELFEQRLEAAQATGAALERERVFLGVDIRSNALIVSASAENFDEIAMIAIQLDTRPARLFDQIRLVKCERLSARDVKVKIDELWQRKAELRREDDLLEDLPIVVVDDRSNTLIIASNVEDYEEIQKLVDTLETQPMIEDTRLFTLEFADAAVLASMLDELFDGIAGASESFTAPTILPDPRSNALVVAGSRDAMERAQHLIARLDVESGPLTATFKVYALSHASAVQLAPRMQELFDSRSEGDEIDRTPIVILPDETSNSLVCSASRDDHSVLVGLLDLLDRPSSLARQFQIFPLKMAKAARVTEELESLFQSQADGASGRADAMAAQADERTNSIIVWASPSQMTNIAEIIGRLDTSKPAVEMMVRVIQLKQALAEDFADLLRRTVTGEDAGADDERAVILAWADKQRVGPDKIRRLLRQDIKIEADPRTNSLMVLAPSDSMDMLEAMIRDFDMIRPIRSELRLFPLINSDAGSMVDQLTEIFDPDGGGDGEATSQLVFGDTIGDIEVASVGQDLRFAADTRTNTLIVAGAEVDLRMVEELVRYLDAQAVESRITEVYRANYRNAQDLASAIQGFNQQEADILGDIDDAEARTRIMERQVSVEAVGNEDEGSSSLIVGMGRRNYADTMRMIRELDRPEPQVRISVLIAELTLTDSIDFGIEIAGQDLQFSEEAIVGPNGIIQGSNFDYIAGTALGAAAALGFNFTITGEDFSFLLHALQQSSRLEILSRPTIVVRNGDEGNITIADQIPFVQSSQINDTGSTNSVIGREDVGIVLTTRPHISPDGYVTIELTQEISNFSGENLQLTEGVSSPVFSTREVTTNVTLRDGETIVIGGLITSRRSEGVNKVPFFGDLPWIGPLFRSTKVSEQKTELLILMTVDVLRTAEDTRRMSLAERDRFMFPDSMLQSPLLEGLRILPDQELLGPKDEDPRTVPPESVQQQPEERGHYGPRPRIYGPIISRPKPTARTERTVYGPKIVRNDPVENE